ncbi:UDP-4-amino-4,6-dideoxy-N-acetyl-beta-L-altrosamine transaminase [Guyparkeria halophila]|uniref:UDP-4-amino-4, 6-dideoxy-N-acetyl-beta-L-altrosamine transaminase n=1 Tax=Guyparkeria halophila TaxID=47960 RepID=A0ABZ0Z148_9GAMM|nr:UDP-4-amino-4,6-dideoxy-N-acetyl-beta-L-altrosamine transaminase [Guyparkeria halophila]WQH17141.1 UDP-4-amino-4,6-dideoxy-N-acetyl-beta-L-altrosamine transaminase [Guyparkeria halophila]
MIPYGRQDIRQEDIDAVTAVLRSDFLTQGPVVPRFERQLADRVDAGHGVACNSATSALHVACLALGVGPGEIVWTSANTFVASANCARYCGATVDFVDVDPETGNMSVAALRVKLEVAAHDGQIPRVVIPVHFAGQPCDMGAIGELADEYGFSVIEDASHAIGGNWHGDPIGSGRHSDITVFSFHPVKIITTGEGGMAVTNDAGIAEHMSLLRSHGVTRDPGCMSREPDGPWYYEQIELGFNYRLTEIAAALGESQLARLDDYVERRRALAKRYDRLLSGLPCRPLARTPGAESAWHLYVVRLDDPVRRRSVFDALRHRDIGVNVHYIPVPSQPDFARLGFDMSDFPGAASYYAGAMSLPLHPGLSEGDQDRVVSALREALA